MLVHSDTSTEQDYGNVSKYELIKNEMRTAKDLHIPYCQGKPYNSSTRSHRVCYKIVSFLPPTFSFLRHLVLDGLFLVSPACNQL
jgi:hypothetical protein